MREALLDAAARVIARQGYAGTKIQDIVREAGLSSGAVYGRFRSNEELVRILQLGLLLLCGSGLPTPDQSSWEHLMSKVMASFGSSYAAAG